MAGSSWGRARAIAPTAVVAVVVALIMAPVPAVASSRRPVAVAAAAGWSSPFQFQQPGTLDALAPQLTFSPGGAAAAGFGTDQVDVPGSAQAQYATRTASGHVSPVHDLAGARQILAISYDGPRLQLLAGVSGAGKDCCSAVETVAVGAGGAPRKPHKLVGNLSGFTQGQLLTLGRGRLLAAVATARGVWVARAGGGDRFGASERISGNGAMPQSLDAAALRQGGAIVAWASARGRVAEAADPRQILVSRGSATSDPPPGRIAVTVAPGDRVDQVAVAGRGTGATLAWIESSTGPHGAFRSRVEVADLNGRPRALSSAGRLASGVSLVSDPAGDEGIVWESCTTGGACTVQGAGRPAGGGFGPVKTLGPIDPTQTPALAISSSGQLLAGWEDGGHPVASVGFGQARQLSETTFAYAVTVAYGPRHTALESWDQGTLHPSLVAAAYHG